MRIPRESLPSSTFPFTMDVDPQGQQAVYGLADPNLQSLIVSGLLSQVMTEEPLRDLFGRTRAGINGPQMAQKAKIDLTPDGRAHWQEPNKMGPGSPGGFCAGRLVVDAVDGFTVPADQAGMRVSQVTFKSHTALDPWATKPELAPVVARLAANAQPAFHTLPFKLTDKGWVVATELPAIR